MKKLLAGFLLFSAPVFAENLVEKPFTEQYGGVEFSNPQQVLTWARSWEKKSLFALGVTRPDQHKSSFGSDFATAIIVDCQSGLFETTINHSVQGSTDKSLVMDWVKGTVVSFCNYHGNTFKHRYWDEW